MKIDDLLIVSGQVKLGHFYWGDEFVVFANQLIGPTFSIDSSFTAEQAREYIRHFAPDVCIVFLDYEFSTSERTFVKRIAPPARLPGALQPTRLPNIPQERLVAIADKTEVRRKTDEPHTTEVSIKPVTDAEKKEAAPTPARKSNVPLVIGGMITIFALSTMWYASNSSFHEEEDTYNPLTSLLNLLIGTQQKPSPPVIVIQQPPANNPPENSSGPTTRRSLDPRLRGGTRPPSYYLKQYEEARLRDQRADPRDLDPRLDNDDELDDSSRGANDREELP